MGPAVLKATKNAMVHLDIVEAKTFGRCHCNSTSVLFSSFLKNRRVEEMGSCDLTVSWGEEVSLGALYKEEIHMVPAGVDVADLACQLKVDGVAYTSPALSQDALLNAEVAQGLRDGDGVAVVDVIADRAPDVRDIAQELQDATGLNTVIVQTPRHVSSVSDTYSRADIESVQAQIPPGVEQVDLLSEYYRGLDQISFPVGAAVGMVAVIAVIVFVSSFLAAGRHTP